MLRAGEEAERKGVKIAAGLQCQQCHGEVQTMDVINAPDPVWGGRSMGWCIDCHRADYQATTSPIVPLPPRGGRLARPA